jgi:hypothetical protein
MSKPRDAAPDRVGEEPAEAQAREVGRPLGPAVQDQADRQPATVAVAVRYGGVEVHLPAPGGRSAPLHPFVAGRDAGHGHRRGDRGRAQRPGAGQRRRRQNGRGGEQQTAVHPRIGHTGSTVMPPSGDGGIRRYSSVDSPQWNADLLSGMQISSVKCRSPQWNADEFT